MYAVIETGGKQYRVELGSELAIERLEATPGSSISFDRVLLVADGDNAQVGTPTVAEALVTADVVRQDRGEKVIVFKYRPKARHRAKKGHRQEQTVIRVADIRFNGRSAAEEAGKQQAQESKARRQAHAEAEKKAAADQALAAKLAADAAPKSAPEAEAKAKPSTAKPAAKPTATTKKAAPKAKAKATADDAPAAQPKKQPTKTTSSRAKASTKKDE